MRVEPIILYAMLNDAEFIRKVFPHLKNDYFQKRSEGTVFSLIHKFYSEYAKLPPKDVLSLELESINGLSEDDYSDTKDVIKDLFTYDYKYEPDWLLKETEKFCKDKSLYNAIMHAVKIINGDDKKYSENQIPTLMQEALAVSFDHNVGHDYFADAAERYEFYHRKETGISTSIELLNLVTNGKIPKKTLNLIMAPLGGGKSAVKCSLAADYLQQGYNVLYITLELAEERVAERIDANMFNVPISEVSNIPRDSFLNRVNKIHEKTNGKLVVKEYPPSSISAANIRSLLDELKRKKGFVPDVVFVDYLGILLSARYSSSTNVNTYTTQKSVAEELRSIAVEYEMLFWSSVQTNRSGLTNNDFDIDDVSDSIGVLMTADFVMGVIRTEELTELGQLLLKQLKNRYGDLNYFKKFVVGFDFSRMKMYNTETNSQTKETQSKIKSEEAQQTFMEQQENTGWDYE